MPRPATDLIISRITRRDGMACYATLRKLDSRHKPNRVLEYLSQSEGMESLVRV